MVIRLFISASLCFLTLPGTASTRVSDLLASLTDEALKTRLLACEQIPTEKHNFVIAHRGAPLGYPEHSEEGYRAAAKQGSGWVECDVTFTKDGQFVCRHSQCDLHRTTNILATPLAQHCSTPFTPASEQTPAKAQCCTSDITLPQFRSLCARPDHVDPSAQTVRDYLTDRQLTVNAESTSCGTLMTLNEQIAMNTRMGVKHVPELKAAMVGMPFNGMSQSDYADRMIQSYLAAGVEPTHVYPQSFSLDDVLYWIEAYPEIADQVIYLDPRGRDRNFQPSLQNMQALYDQGLRILAPPIPMLIKLNDLGEIAPSEYAQMAKTVGFDLITWTLESRPATDPGNFTYATVREAIQSEGDVYKVLDALVHRVGIRAIFTDWPETVYFFAQCMEIDAD